MESQSYGGHCFYMADSGVNSIQLAQSAWSKQCGNGVCKIRVVKRHILIETAIPFGSGMGESVVPL